MRLDFADPVRGSWATREAAEALHLVPWEFHQEGAGDSRAGLAAERAIVGVAELQFLAGPGNTDEHEPALFFEFFLVVHTPFMRQEAVLDGNNKCARELEPLGRVQRHER